MIAMRASAIPSPPQPLEPGAGTDAAAMLLLLLLLSMMTKRA